MKKTRKRKVKEKVYLGMSSLGFIFRQVTRTQTIRQNQSNEPPCGTTTTTTKQKGTCMYECV